MNPIFPISLAAVLLIGTTVGSPVARVIETTKSLKAINATVECEVHRFPDDRECPGDNTRRRMFRKS